MDKDLNRISTIPRGKVIIPDIETQGKISVPADTTALIIVDMQNDFVDPDGSLYVPAAKETVGEIENLAKEARAAGSKIVYTQDTCFNDDPEWDIWPKHCLYQTWGWKIIDDLQPKSKDLICRKNRYDGFYGTWLEHHLTHIWRIRHLILVGTVANICVLHTAGSAALRWIQTIIPANGISALNEFDQALTLRQMTFLYAGMVVEKCSDIVFNQQ